MIDNATAAQSLYGDTDPINAPAPKSMRPTPPPSLYGEYRPTLVDVDRTSTDAAGTLYEEVAVVSNEDVLAEYGFETPSDIINERESSLSSTFGYDESSVSDETKTNLGETIDEITPDIPRSLRDAAIIGYSQIASDIGITHSETNALVNIAKRDAKLASDPEVRTAWRKEASDYIRNQYGSRANQVLRDAQQVVKRDPRLSRMLDATGLGDHPKFVIQLCERAVSMRNAGKLGRKSK